MVISPEWSSLKRIEAVQTEWPRKVYVKRWKCSNCVQSSEPLNTKVYLFGWILEVPDRVHHELAHLSHFTHSFAFFRSTYIELEIKESLGPIFELVENMYLHEINRNHLESHDRYDLRVEIFMEQEWRFGLDLGRLASTLSNVAKIFCLNSPLKHSVSIVFCFNSLLF